jgi:hypothetical protein
MGFNDGLADRQAKAKTIGLGSEERFEQMGQLLGFKSNALVDDMNRDTVIQRLNDDTQVLSFSRQISIGVHGIFDQIE